LRERKTKEKKERRKRNRKRERKDRKKSNKNGVLFIETQRAAYQRPEIGGY